MTRPHAFVNFNRVDVALPANWTVQFAAGMSAANIGPLPDGRTLWTLVDPMDVKFESAKKPGSASFHRIQGGQKATWIIGPASIVDAEVPHPIHGAVIDAAVKKFLKFNAGGSAASGFPRVDAVKNDVIRSHGPAVDSMFVPPTGTLKTLGWWAYNSHRYVNWIAAPGRTVNHPSGFQTWMHFGSTPSRDAGSRGGTNGRYEGALWLLENYLMNPTLNEDSYRFALQMARHQVSHGFVWDGGGLFGHTRRYESSSLDFPGDEKDPSRNHNWGAEWWLLYAMSGDPCFMRPRCCRRRGS